MRFKNEQERNAWFEVVRTMLNQTGSDIVTHGFMPSSLMQHVINTADQIILEMRKREEER